MKIEYDGVSYEYDEEAITVSQALKIEEHTGGTLMEYAEGLLKGSTKCYQALGWILFRHADVRVPIAGLDFPVLKLAGPYIRTLGDMYRAAQEEAAAEPEDPTLPSAGTSPTRRSSSPPE